MPSFPVPARHPGDPRIADPDDTAATPIQLGRAATAAAIRAVEDSCRHLAGARKLCIGGGGMPIAGLTSSLTITVDDVAKEPFSGDVLALVVVATEDLDDAISLQLTTGADATGQTVNIVPTGGQTPAAAVVYPLRAGWADGDATDFETDSITLAFTRTSGTYTVFSWHLFVLPPEVSLSTS